MRHFSFKQEPYFHPGGLHLTEPDDRVNDLQKSLYKVNSARLVGKGMFTFPLLGQGMFVFSLVGPADAPRFFTLVRSADVGHNIWSTRI